VTEKIEQNACLTRFLMFLFGKISIRLDKMQGDHSPDNMKFPDISVTVRSTPRHPAC